MTTTTTTTATAETLIAATAERTSLIRQIAFWNAQYDLYTGPITSDVLNAQSSIDRGVHADVAIAEIRKYTRQLNAIDAQIAELTAAVAADEAAAAVAADEAAAAAAETLTTATAERASLIRRIAFWNAQYDLYTGPITADKLHGGTSIDRGVHADVAIAEIRKYTRQLTLVEAAIARI